MSLRRLITIALLSMLAAPAFAADDARAKSPHARNLAATCSACHTRDGADNPAIAPLDGRPATDVANAMRAFRSGERTGTVMPQLARGYTDADIDAIATWYAAQRR